MGRFAAIPRTFGPLDPFDRLDVVGAPGAGAAPPPHLHRWAGEDVPAAGLPWPATSSSALLALFQAVGGFAAYWTGGPAFKALGYAPGDPVTTWPDEYGGLPLTPFYASHMFLDADGWLTPEPDLAVTYNSAQINDRNYGRHLAFVSGIDAVSLLPSTAGLGQIVQPAAPGIGARYISSQRTASSNTQLYASSNGDPPEYINLGLIPNGERGVLVGFSPPPDVRGGPWGGRFFGNQNPDRSIADSYDFAIYDWVDFIIGLGSSSGDNSAVRRKFFGATVGDPYLSPSWPAFQAALQSELERPTMDVVSGATRTNVTVRNDPVTHRRMYHSLGAANSWAQMLGVPHSEIAQPCSYSFVFWLDPSVVAVNDVPIQDGEANPGGRNLFYSPDTVTVWHQFAGTGDNLAVQVVPGDTIAVCARYDGDSSRVLIQGRTTPFTEIASSCGDSGMQGMTWFAFAGSVLGANGIAGAMGEHVYAPGVGWTDQQMHDELARLRATWRI